MIFKYHLIRSKENLDFLYIFDESKTKLLATIDEAKRTESGFGEFVLVSENIILDINFIVKKAKYKEKIKTEQRQDYIRQLENIKADAGDALLITDILWSYRDSYCKQ